MEITVTVETRHKWWRQHPGRHSTQMGWQHPGRYSTQMRMAAPRSILDTNGAGCKHVDIRHKWRGLYPSWYSIQTMRAAPM